MIIRYFLLHLILAISAVQYLIHAYGLPQSALGLHLSVICFVHATGYLLFLLTARLSYLRYLTITLVAVYWLYLLLLYGLNWFSYLNWGSGVMFDFMIHLPQQIKSIAQAEGISVPLIGITFMLICSVFMLLSKAFYQRLITGIQMGRHRSGKWAVYALLYVVFFCFYLSVTYQRTDPRAWSYEPLMSSFALNNSAFQSNLSKLEQYEDALEAARYQRTGVKNKPQKNVVLIIVDALRADRLPVYGYDKPTTPFLQTLSDKIQKVDYFTSTCSESICGIYSILSARLYRYFAFQLFDLPALLKLVGYNKYYILSSNHNYNALNQLHGEDVDYYVDGNDFGTALGLHDDEGVINHLQNIPAYDGVPSFFYFHLMSAHSLGKNKAPFNQYQPSIEHVSGFVGKQVTEDLQQKSMQLSNGYDNGVMQTDDYIRRIHAILEAKGFLEDSIFIITSDHGDGLGERGYFFHTYNLYHEDINIPLLWIADECQLQNTRYATQIDVAPTVADCLGLPVPETWQGRSLLKASAADRVTLHQTIRDKKTVMVILENEQHLYKLMAAEHDGVYTDYQLFDYYADPSEQHDLIDEADPALVNKLKSILHTGFE